MKHSLASPSSVADVMTKKYVNGLPLYHQGQGWKRLGVDLSHNTLANWVIQPTNKWLTPLYGLLRRELLDEPVVHADETHLQVLKENGRAATAQSEMWVYASAERSGWQIRCFDYRDSWNGERAKEFLEGFHGVLVSDGYGGYNKLNGMTRAGCWAHVQRK